MSSPVGQRNLLLLILIISACILGQLVGAADEKDSLFAKLRLSMVETQLVPRGITDEHVLMAFKTVERHRFVAEVFQSLAYDDQPLPIAADQTISQPYIVALMTQLLQLTDESRVLEVGTGSGYQAAILAEIAAQVFSIEIIDTLASSSERLLKELGYENIVVRCGDGFKGWPEEAPFDGIILTCSPAKIPAPLIEQLAEGGRLVAPVGVEWQELVLLQKKNGVVTEKKVAAVRFVPMTGEALKQE